MMPRFLDLIDLDFFLVAMRYTLLEQESLETELPYCERRNVGIVIGGVYNSGLLADPKPGATYNYVEAPPALVERAQQLGEICASHGVPLKAAAIQFPLAHPAVATILTGARSVDELNENITMMEYQIPDALWSDLAAAGVERYAG
jgi:D-threo-aldose 1-dehydrogenase